MSASTGMQSFLLPLKKSLLVKEHLLDLSYGQQIKINSHFWFQTFLVSEEYVQYFSGWWTLTSTWSCLNFILWKLLQCLF